MSNNTRWTIEDLRNNTNIRTVDGKEQKPSKHRAIKKTIDDIVFDSTKEANRYTQLKMQAKAGLISNLETQRTYPLVVRQWIVNGVVVDLGYQYMRAYVADFVYTRDGEEIVEDVKSSHTKNLRAYKIKKMLMKKLYNIEITEV